MKAEGRDKQALSLDSDRRNKMNPAETGATSNTYDTAVILEKQKPLFLAGKRVSRGPTWNRTKDLLIMSQLL